MRTSPLRDALREAAAPQPSSGWDVVEVRLRLPRKLMAELRGLANSEDLSINAMVAAFIDAALVERGRKPITQVAPWFASYLRSAGKRREGAPKSQEEAEPDFT